MLCFAYGVVILYLGLAQWHSMLTTIRKGGLAVCRGESNYAQ